MLAGNMLTRPNIINYLIIETDAKIKGTLGFISFPLRAFQEVLLK